MGTIFINARNSNTNEPHKLVPEFFQIFDLRSSNKHGVLQNFKNVREQYKNNKLKLIATKWTDEFELSGRSFQCQIFNIIANIS